MADVTTAAPRVILPRPRSATAAGRLLDLTAVLAGSKAPRLVLQPIVDVRAGQVAGYEALARFGARTTTSPAPWFATADRMQCTPELESLLIVAALQRVDDLPAAHFVSVNVSPGLLSHPSVIAAFASRPDLSQVVIELTESVEFGHSSTLTAHLAGLRARGARLALDDVGAGWAGLRQITELRPDIVKLDRSLVEAVDRDEVKLALAEMMLRLCSRLGAQLLVEGVETYAELDVFARLGVPLAQGWVFGRPEIGPTGIDDDLAVRLKFMAGLVRHVDKVAALVDVTSAVMAPGPPPPPAEAHEGDALVTVDDDRNPSHVHVKLADQWWSAPATTVHPNVPISQALLQALTRPPAARFLPLVCVDKGGRYVGTVSVDALAAALARSPAGRDATPLPT